MRDCTLANVNIAIVATNGFEQSELGEPKRLLEAAGANVDVIAPESGTITGWKHNNWGDEVKVDKTVDLASAGDYDALVIPGGVINPDKLRLDRGAVNFIRQFACAAQTDRCNLPRSADVDRSRSRPRATGHVLAVPADGSEKCGCAMA